MCRIFANQDPKSYAFSTRSVRLAGHSTSLRLERQFWDILAEIAAKQGMTLPRLLSELHDEVLEARGEVRNFASLLRNACVLYLRHGEGLPLAAPLAHPATPKVAPIVPLRRAG
ncbi:MAG TPA: ribbon-helix-helix domain-containing protein [Acetobacteraceae bacterium]|nr:ribbon-helix-helix domain-containing protein [Acetobacteraceae bacterium]